MVDILKNIMNIAYRVRDMQIWVLCPWFLFGRKACVGNYELCTR